jgi:aminoglycoside/choline kinase family phosphotransferase
MIPHSAFRNPQYESLIAFSREALGLPQSVAIELAPLEGRGSDRSYFRLRWAPDNSAILVRYDPKRIENTYYAVIAGFLHDINVPVPRLAGHDRVRCLILMEDLGNTDLWSLREASWEIRQPLYQKTLAIVHRLHSFPEKDFPSERVRLMEPFGPDLYRWERDYFRDHFVRDVCGINLDALFSKELEGELSSLAGRLSRQKRSLVHRDFQSQNVMIRDGNPFLIDFQGMRFGSPFYDLGSILCDPYIEFSDAQRIDLLLYYYGLSKQNLTWDDFQKMFWEASSQRLMQALGAYGFLGLEKGLKSFLDHIPPGLRNLDHAASKATSLPRLLELVQLCQSSIRNKV